jgi:hypothetical protein
VGQYGSVEKKKEKKEHTGSVGAGERERDGLSEVLGAECSVTARAYSSVPQNSMAILRLRAMAAPNSLIHGESVLACTNPWMPMS